MEGIYIHQNLGLDEVGTYATPIIERLSRLRKAHYETMTLLIHPQSVGVNLLLNSLRAAKGHHFADPDYLYRRCCIIQFYLYNSIG